MRSTWVLTVVLALFSPPVAAQAWSPQQEEVLAHVRACWDAWRTKDFDRWISVCRPAPDFAHWQTGQGAPQRIESWRKTAEHSWRATSIQYDWYDIRPLVVQISGDVAVVHFYGYFASTVDAQQTVREGNANRAVVLLAARSSPQM